MSGGVLSIKKKAGGRIFKRGKREKEKEALSEAINSKKRKINKNHISVSSLIFETQKQKTIKYELSRYWGKCKRAEDTSIAARSCPGRGSVPRNEP